MSDEAALTLKSEAENCNPVSECWATNEAMLQEHCAQVTD